MRSARTLTKADIVAYVMARMSGFSIKETAAILDGVFKLLQQTLVNGENIKLSKFGNFEVRIKKERNGRNPQTGAAIPISARRVVKFKPSQVLKESLKR